MNGLNRGKMVAIVVVSTIGFLGCVSSSKYKKLETDSKKQEQTLSEKNKALEAELASLNQQMGDLKNANSALSQQTEALKKDSAQIQDQYQNVVGRLQQEVQEGNLKVTQYQNMLTVDVAEKLFFDSGSATLKKSGQAVLKKVGEALVELNDKVVRIVGHTDNVPLSKKYQHIFPTNWELSVLRATNVVRFLQEQCNIAPDRLIASGRGEYEPVAPNDTPEGRRQNRRIEIVLVDKSVVEAMQAKRQQ